jgi:hypothetical protein
MSLKPTKAKKNKRHLKLAISGPAGSGKTFTALKLAKSIGGKTVVIDTEGGRSQHYAELFQFDVLEIPADSKDLEPVALLGILKELSQDYEIIIIDSFSHSWNQLLTLVDQINEKQKSNNKFAAWRIGSSRQTRLAEGIAYMPVHLIATMRAKQKYVMQRNKKGEVIVNCLGVQAIQGKDIEYEFDLVCSISREHSLKVQKASGDIEGKIENKTFDKPDEAFFTSVKELFGL